MVFALARHVPPLVAVMTYHDYLTDTEALRLEQLRADIADLMRMKAALNSEADAIKKRAGRRKVDRAETVRRQQRRAADRQQMYGAAL